MNTIKSSVVAVTLITACLVLKSQAEYVSCVNTINGSKIGEIEYISSLCTRSDGYAYLQPQVHLDLMSAGANRPSNDPVVEEVVPEVDREVALKAEIEQTIVDFNDYASIFFALTTSSPAADPDELQRAKERVSDAAKKIISLRSKMMGSANDD